jgi:hypothetical protein
MGTKKYCSLWERPMENGTSDFKQYSGTVTIEGKEYWVNLYEADPARFKQNPPAFSVSLNPKMQRQDADEIPF